ncbi:MAG: hypothetical protein JNK37_12300 [Verrucomicrobiales bacterium]|nr:hypothetical protein [Verrucomicrobiales bacterium]
MRLPVALCLFVAASALHAAPPTADAVKAALVRGVTFQHREVARHGGYVYRQSADLSLREAEGIPAPDTIWIQPPGTPAVGEAFLDAYEATRDPACAQAALDAALALTRTQMHSGGWYYSGHFGEQERAPWFHRLDPQGQPLPDPTPTGDRDQPAGWHLTREAKYRGKNETILDDNVTQAALHFLIRIDQALSGRNAEIRGAVEHGLTALLNAQYPGGGWSASFDRYPAQPADAAAYPPIKASYPDDWPRTWPKDFRGCYVTNDELMTRCVTTLIRAHLAYGATDPRPMAALRRAGDFILAAQMPEPQPAWAQQYDEAMKPCWSRAFEPPAISTRESEGLLRSLIEIAALTGDRRYLEPVPRALAYLRKCELPEKKLPRFLELRTDRPLYFTRGPGGKGFEMTYDDSRLSSNYGWINDSHLDEIEADFRAVLGGAPLREKPPVEPGALAETVSGILAAQDDRGAWSTAGGIMRDASGRKTEPVGGVIESATFIANVAALCQFLETAP